MAYSRTLSARLALGILLACSPYARADFSYQQTSRMTGGSMLNFLSMIGGRVTQSVTATISVKGGKMAYATPHMMSIIDLEAKTISTVNLDRKTYWVMTFDEAKAAMESITGPDGVTITDFRVDMKDGPNTRTVLQKETHEKVVTVLMAGTDSSGKIVNTQMDGHIFASDEIEGVKELREFDKRLGGLPWSPGLQGLNNPEMNKALAGLFTKVRQIVGLPLVIVMTVSGAVPGIPADMSGLQNASPEDQPTGGMLSGKLGGLAAAMKRRSQNADGAGAGSGPLIELTSEVSSYSTKPVASAAFQIPDSFTKTDPPGPAR